MKVLITGFDKFGGSEINPSELAVNSLPPTINNIEIIKLILPTVFYDCSDIVNNAIDFYKPNIIIHIGQAGGRDKISIERVAINIDDARIEDNNGNKPIDSPIQQNGQAAYFSTLSIKAINLKLNEKNIPAEISNTAGTFVCNHLMYQTLYTISSIKENIKSGFIHIPYIPEQVKNKKDSPSMPLETIVTALKIIIKTSCDFYYKEDLTIDAGKEC